MCGIVGYTGQRGTVGVLLEGLSRLEYRGYDSAGVSVLDGDSVALRKKGGKLAVLRGSLEDAPLPDEGAGIGHTRWATHGGPTDENAHPHLGDDGKLSLIHNGIIENFAALRAELEADGETFLSETDTEAAAKMVGRAFRETGDLTTAMQQVVKRLEGQFTLLAVHAEQPGVVVGACHNSPLLVGYGEGEHFLGSDVSAFVKFTPNAAALDNDQIVTITADSASVTDFDGNPLEPKRFEVDWDASAADKGGWSSFMAKEVAEGPEAVANTLRGRLTDTGVDLGELGVLDDATLAGINRIVIVACGTAAYSGLVGKYAIETWSRVPVEVDLAHEFRYRDPVLDEHTLVISISQSGETMDTKMAVQHAKAQGARTLSICNTQGATIPRESEAVLYTHAGPEVAVASTKAFLAQVIGQLLFGLHLARVRGTMTDAGVAEVVAELKELPDALRQVLSEQSSVHELAHWMSDTRSVLFLGRHVGYPVALEGALKLKEISYIQAEGYAAGELKHGPIALIDEHMPVVVIAPHDRVFEKTVSNMHEVAARGGRIILMTDAKGAAEATVESMVTITLPDMPATVTPLVYAIPVQLLAYHTAVIMGTDVDQPRNLAKSVTVE